MDKITINLPYSEFMCLSLKELQALEKGLRPFSGHHQISGYHQSLQSFMHMLRGRIEELNRLGIEPNTGLTKGVKHDASTGR
tara:strand:+ start:272 stop:517 length:246 start_codon:yes stop_codon:yes gene_type:complete